VDAIVAGELLLPGGHDGRNGINYRRFRAIQQLIQPLIQPPIQRRFMIKSPI
jgi:hypothetical protein